jgi:RNA polymerase sigma factor (sigma-70 family)
VVIYLKGLCTDCPKRDSCTKLCWKAKSYANKDLLLRNGKEVTFSDLSKQYDNGDTRDFEPSDKTLKLAEVLKVRDHIFEELPEEKREEILDSMTPKQREVFRLRTELFMRQRDIAEELGISQSSVRDRLKAVQKKIERMSEN